MGFTLIELSIVVAIVGILAAVAIPQYVNYMAQSKTSSAMVELGSLRTRVQLYHEEHNDLPTDGSAINLDGSFESDYWRHPEIEDGKLSVEFINIDKDLNGETISLEPVTRDGMIVAWNCHSTADRKAKLPPTCRP